MKTFLHNIRYHFEEWLLLAVALGAIILLVTGGAALLADLFGGSHYLSMWRRASITLAGGAALMYAVGSESTTLLSRLLIGSTGAVFLLAVADSLDNQLSFIPKVSIMLWVWGSIHADILRGIWHNQQTTQQRRWAALAISAVSLVVYFGAALYYIWRSRVYGPQYINSHPLLAFGIATLFLSQTLGEIRPNSATPNRGLAWVCPNCGLQNIAERQTCKRCGTRFRP